MTPYEIQQELLNDVKECLGDDDGLIYVSSEFGNWLTTHVYRTPDEVENERIWGRPLIITDGTGYSYAIQKLT